MAETCVGGIIELFKNIVATLLAAAREKELTIFGSRHVLMIKRLREVLLDRDDFRRPVRQIIVHDRHSIVLGGPSCNAWFSDLKSRASANQTSQTSTTPSGCNRAVGSSISRSSASDPNVRKLRAVPRRTPTCPQNFLCSLHTSLIFRPKSQIPHSLSVAERNLA